MPYVSSMMPATSHLPSIPVIDVRDGGPVRHARESAARAAALRDECLAWFPALAVRLAPVTDWLARRWLMRSASPYTKEIGEIAAILNIPGIWFLNGSYVWGCTALARAEGGVPWLARTLDWPFPGLGRHVEVARMRGSAGDFVSVTWPGYVGVLTGLAPERFAIAINQAPLWRRTRRPWLRIYDIAANAMNTWRRVRHIPPDQLLRSVFETCRTFDEARQRLETVPVARPVIYTLAGCRPGELCVIERTEEAHTTRFTATATANDWLVGCDGWEGRVGGDVVMSATTAQAAEGSRNRRECLDGWNGSFAGAGFGWLVEPVLNRFTRVAVEMCPASGLLRVVGFEKSSMRDGADQATQRAVVNAAAA
jgi:hypothetical protein